MVLYYSTVFLAQLIRENSEVMYSSTTVQFRLLGYSSERAIRSDTTIPSQTLEANN